MKQSITLATTKPKLKILIICFPYFLFFLRFNDLEQILDVFDCLKRGLKLGSRRRLLRQ